MKIRAYADFSARYMYNLAIENGLSVEAADYFRYFNEVAVDLEVDKETGRVTNATVSWNGD